MVNSKRIGSIETMVASSVVVPVGAARHQIADRDAAVADAAVDRRAQLGELEVELGLTAPPPPAPRLRPRRRAWPACADRRSARDGLAAHKLLAAREIGFGEGKIGARLRQVGVRLLERDLERPAVDGEQQVALLHQLAVLEMDFLQITRDPRPHLDRIDGDKAADIFVLIDNGLLHRPRHRHRGRRRRRFGLGFAALAGSNRQPERHQQENSRHAGGEIGRWHGTLQASGYGALQRYRA